MRVPHGVVGDGAGPTRPTRPMGASSVGARPPRVSTLLELVALGVVHVDSVPPGFGIEMHTRSDEVDMRLNVGRQAVFVTGYVAGPGSSMREDVVFGVEQRLGLARGRLRSKVSGIPTGAEIIELT